jgi:hypothetical protein
VDLDGAILFKSNPAFRSEYSTAIQSEIALPVEAMGTNLPDGAERPTQPCHALAALARWIDAHSINNRPIVLYGGTLGFLFSLSRCKQSNWSRLQASRPLVRVAQHQSNAS